MKGQNIHLERPSFVQRVIVPAAIVLAIMIISLLVYWNSWRIDSVGAHRIVANIAAVVLFVSIGFGSLLVYPMAYFRGANAGERIFASLITPIIWLIKESIRVSVFYTFAETLYYGLNPLYLAVFIGPFGLMGICELVCRSIIKKRSDTSIRVITPLPVAAIFAALVALYVFLIWGGGVHWFYIYMEGYKALFI
ncbi:MAG: hypothetical protein U9P49_02055 [Thermodesulfobacteriota bacterium]|nr:hypothetical protein [Thermodesulfobacteriota bacterium]